MAHPARSERMGRGAIVSQPPARADGSVPRPLSRKPPFGFRLRLRIPFRAHVGC
jgi:hypothetical protein